MVLFRGGIKPAIELALPTAITYCSFVTLEGSGGAVYSGAAAAVGTRKGVFKVADFLVAHDRLGHRSGQTLRYLLPSVWLVFLGRQGGMVV